MDEPACVLGGGCYCSSGGTERPRGVAETLTSNRTGADTAAPADTHRYQTFAGAPAVGSAGTDADTDTPNWDYGHANLATALASGNAGSGLAVATGSRSQRLDYDGVLAAAGCRDTAREIGD